MVSKSIGDFGYDGQAYTLNSFRSTAISTNSNEDVLFKCIISQHKVEKRPGDHLD
jgi:hypothetical protein